MLLTDTGPLVALLDSADPHHAQCTESALTLGTEVMLTTWQCFTEAMHFLRRTGGYPYQANLWSLRRAGRLEIHLTTDVETNRIEELMRQYQDTPMALADASLVAAAESLALRRVFTVDRGFFIYRLGDGSALEVIQ